MCKAKSLSMVMTVAGGTFLACIASTAQPGNSPPGTGGIMNLPPDVEKPVLSEYRHMEELGTRAAFEQFVRRHPGHPLAEQARARLAGGDLK